MPACARMRSGQTVLAREAFSLPRSPERPPRQAAPWHPAAPLCFWPAGRGATTTLPHPARLAPADAGQGRGARQRWRATWGPTRSPARRRPGGARCLRGGDAFAVVRTGLRQPPLIRSSTFAPAPIVFLQHSRSSDSRYPDSEYRLTTPVVMVSLGMLSGGRQGL